MTPKVSVILPTRNRAHTLKRSIDSVLASTFKDFELIVVDDGSTDGTQALLKSYADPRLRCVVNEGRHSCPAARNVGLRLAKAPLIAFQDSDDEYLPRKLEVQVAALEQLPAEVGLVYGPMLQIRLDGTRRRLESDVFTAADTGLFPRLLDASMGVAIGTVMLRRSALDAAGLFDEELRSREDLDLCLRLALTHRFHRLDEQMIRYHESPDSLSKSYDAIYDAYRRIFDKHRDHIEADPAAKAAMYRLLGGALLPTPRAAESRAWLWKLLRTGRARPADWVWLAVSCGGPRLYAALRALKSLANRTLPA